MTVSTNPNHPANRFPWNVHGSRARATVTDFLDVALAEIADEPDALPFRPATGRLVLLWLIGQMDRAPRT